MILDALDFGEPQLMVAISQAANKSALPSPSRLSFVPLSETTSQPALPVESHPRERRRWRLLIPATLLLIYALQCFWFIRTQSLTVDEPGHIAAGLAMWRHGRFVMLNDQPPLARLIFTAPLAAS